MIHLHPRMLAKLKSEALTVDYSMTDMHKIRRSWFNRLFTLPWTPQIKYKSVYCPIVYLLDDGSYLVSPETKARIEASL